MTEAVAQRGRAHLTSHNRTEVSKEPVLQKNTRASCQRIQNGTESRKQPLAEERHAPLASTLASAFHATVLILPTCPLNRRTMSPDVTSQRKTLRSPPHEANRVLSYELPRGCRVSPRNQCQVQT